MTRQLFVIATIFLIGCAEPEPKPKTLEAFTDIGYNMCLAIKSGDKESFLELLDPKIYDYTPKDKMLEMFDVYKKAIDDYKLPPYDVFKKDHLWVTYDTLKQNLIFGFPFESNPTGICEGLFKIKFSEDNKIIGLFLDKIPDPKTQPDDLFPPTLTKFDLDIERLNSVVFFRLPGPASEHPPLKNFVIEKNELLKFKDELKAIIDTLNSCEIQGLEKTLPSHEPNTDDLKRIELEFGNPLYVISIMNTTMLDKYVSVQAHRGKLNCNHTYELADTDKRKLMRLLSEYVPRHIK